MKKTPKEQDKIVSNNESYSKSSNLLHQEKGNLASTLNDKDLTIENIKESIKIDDEGDIMGITKIFINRIGLNREFYNSTFIHAVTQHQISNGEHLRGDWDIIGFRKAEAILKNNPQEKIVAYSIVPIDFGMYTSLFQLQDLFTIKRCLENPNFVIVDAIGNSDFSDLKFGQGHNKNFYEGICKYIQSRKYEYIGTIRHRLRIRSEEFNVKNLLEDNKLALELYNEYNSIYGPCTFEEFIKIITDNVGYREGIDIMKGKKLVGVYCDIDGTLIVRGKDGLFVNEKVLNYLKEQEKLGKEIHLWTGGEIYQQQQILKHFGIKYPLMSKYKYPGAKAETVIDNLDYDKFVSKYSIKVKNYINVDNL